MSSEVVRWLHWAVIPSPLKVRGKEDVCRYVLSGWLIKLHLTGPYTDPCLARAFWVSQFIYPKQFERLGRVPPLKLIQKINPIQRYNYVQGAGMNINVHMKYLSKLCTIKHICCIHALSLDREFIRKVYRGADTHSVVLDFKKQMPFSLVPQYVRQRWPDILTNRSLKY